MHLLAKTYGRRPSEIAGIRDEWAAYQFDVAALMAGLDTDDGKGATGPVSYDWSDLV